MDSSTGLGEALRAIEDSGERFEQFVEGGTTLDGHSFVGVASTRIYCRPVCHPASLPHAQNCTYYDTAAAAEAKGYRPCKLCRPEIAPGVKYAGDSFGPAARAALALRTGYSQHASAEEILARAGFDAASIGEEFEREQGACFEQYLLTCRLQGAKALLTDTRLPIEQVAAATGFADEAQLRALLKQHYRFAPEDFRRRKLSAAQLSAPGVAFFVGYRAPYEFDKLLEFFRYRQLNGVEAIDDRSYARTVRLQVPMGREAGADAGAAPAPAPVAGAPAQELFGWIRVENDAKHNRLACRMSESLLPAYSQVIARIRHTFDTDCDPEVVFSALGSLNDAVPGANVCGTRVPGAFDPFEITVRAILGQQVSVLAANKMAERIALAYGRPLDTGIPGLTCTFPTRDDFLAMDPIEDALGVHGVIKARSRTIRTLAELSAQGELDLAPTAQPAKQMQRLLAVKGIGPWSANYICMRALGYTDAFLEKDAGIKHALPTLEPAERLATAESWRPWRSYANVSLWNSLT